MTDHTGRVHIEAERENPKSEINETIPCGANEVMKVLTKRVVELEREKYTITKAFTVKA